MSFCIDEGLAFAQCRTMDTTGKCASCAPVNFDTILQTFPMDLKAKFMMTMAYALPGDPSFCPTAQDGICADYASNTCCCEGEFAAWQSCLVEKDFSIGIALSPPCTVACESPAGGGEGGGGGGGSMVTIVIVIILVLVAGGGLGRYLFIRKRRANANSKSIGDYDDDDTFKDESGKSSLTGGFFSIFKKGSGTPPGSESEDYDRKKRKGKKNGRNRSEHDMDDVEIGGLIPEVPRYDEDTEEDDRRARRSRNGSRKKRYEEEDSIDNKYGEHSKAGIPRNARGSPRSRYTSESEDNFDDDTISEFSKDYGKSRVSSSDLPDKIQSSRKISSRELKELMRDREERSRQVDFMQQEMRDFEERLSKRDREAEDLRRSRADQDRRIRELEAMNARLKKESMKNHSGRSSTSDHYGDGDEYGNGNGHASRSKASIREGEDKKSKIEHRRRNGRSRSASGRSLVERSNSGRSLKRQGSNKSIGNQRHRSPSSSRGLGKQSSSKSKSKLEQDDPREYSKSRDDRRSSSRNARGSRSKSPRSYLRDGD